MGEAAVAALKKIGKKIAKRLAMKVAGKAKDAALGKKKENKHTLLKTLLAIFLVLLLLVSIITNLISLIFNMLGFATAGTYDAVFSQKVVNELTEEQVKNYFGNTVPNPDDPRYQIYQAISMQFYGAVSGQGHLKMGLDDNEARAVNEATTYQNAMTVGLAGGDSGSVYVGQAVKNIEWESVDGIEKLLNEYKSYIETKHKNTDKEEYNIVYKNGSDEVYGSKVQESWDIKDMRTYQGKARSTYTDAFWTNKAYAKALTEMCQAKLSVQELQEIENYKGGEKPNEFNICKKLANGITDLNTEKVFGKGAFTSTEKIVQKNEWLTNITGKKYYDVEVTIEDFKIPFVFFNYENNAAKEVEYKTVDNEQTLNLAVSMLKHLNDNDFQKEKDENGKGKGKWELVDDKLRTVNIGNGLGGTGLADSVKNLIGQVVNLVSYRGKDNVGDVANSLDSNFDLEAFDDWYKGNGYSKGYAEFVNIKHPTATSNTMLGSSVQDYVYARLRNETGCDHYTACGFMGNIGNESGWNPTDGEPVNGAYGLCQWTNGAGSTRLGDMRNLAEQNGKDPNSVEAQTDYMVLDLNTGHSKDVDACNTYKSADDTAVYMMCKYYAAPSVPIEKTMRAYTERGRQITTHSFSFVGEQNGIGNQNFKTEERIASAQEFDAIYAQYKDVPNGQVQLASNAKQVAAQYCISHVGDRYDQGNRMGEGVYDCSSLVCRAYAEAGVTGLVNGGSALTTYGLWDYFKANGVLIPYDENYIPEVGDVYMYGYSSAGVDSSASSCTHVDMYVGQQGDFCIVGASSPETGVIKKNAPQSSNPSGSGRYVMAVGRLLI